MKAVFVEFPAFERYREKYLDDDRFRALQLMLMGSPEAGDAIPGAGGLCKLRFGDPRRGKGKRGGLRVIYYWWSGGPEFWLFTLYDKDGAEDLTPEQRERFSRSVSRREERAMTKKRDLFKELIEGFDALAEQRDGKRTLRTHAVKVKPAPRIAPRRAH